MPKGVIPIFHAAIFLGPRSAIQIAMQYECDAPGGAVWFRIETAAEAEAESALMGHAVNRHFDRAYAAAIACYRPVNPNSIERDIGLKAHVRAVMPVFLTLRDGMGAGLATAMLPPGLLANPRFKIIIVGPFNGDPYPAHGAAIALLGVHCNLALPREECFPYK
jgi:hypothetical protein